MCCTFQICLSSILPLLEAYFCISHTALHLLIRSSPLSFLALYFFLCIVLCASSRCLFLDHVLFLFQTRKSTFIYIILQHAYKHTGKTNLIPRARIHAFKFLKHPLHVKYSINILLTLAWSQEPFWSAEGSVVAGGTSSSAVHHQRRVIQSLGRIYRSCTKFRQLFTISLKGLWLTLHISRQSYTIYTNLGRFQ